MNAPVAPLSINPATGASGLDLDFAVAKSPDVGGDEVGRKRSNSGTNPPKDVIERGLRSPDAPPLVVGVVSDAEHDSNARHCSSRILATSTSPFLPNPSSQRRGSPNYPPHLCKAHDTRLAAPPWSTRKARQNSIAGPPSTSLDTVLSLLTAPAYADPQRTHADVDIDVLEVLDPLPTHRADVRRPPHPQRARPPCTHCAAFHGRGDLDSKCNAVDAYTYPPAPRSLRVDSVKTVRFRRCRCQPHHPLYLGAYLLDALDGFRIVSLAADAVTPVKKGTKICFSPAADGLASPPAPRDLELVGAVVDGIKRPESLMGSYVKSGFFIPVDDLASPPAPRSLELAGVVVDGIKPTDSSGFRSAM
ncbi:hypothetical protein C8R46DRAFT_1210503 [Mycena filopes]|nr:hypothetical protein C8R46DRAFT_1210503 [Mycena filopes]